jgi:hypothetical protein
MKAQQGIILVISYQWYTLQWLKFVTEYKLGQTSGLHAKQDEL